MYNPPMMFWHTSRALFLDYYMVPVPQSYWLQKEFAVSIREVVQVLKLGLRNYGDYSKKRKTQSLISCPPGWGIISQPLSQDSSVKARCEMCGMKAAAFGVCCCFFLSFHFDSRYWSDLGQFTLQGFTLFNRTGLLFPHARRFFMRALLSWKVRNRARQHSMSDLPWWHVLSL